MTETLQVTNEQLLLASTAPDGSHRLVLALHLADTEATMPLPAGVDVLEQSVVAHFG